MKMRSAWLRGLAYGGFVAGGMAIVPIFVALFAQTPFSEVAMAGGIIFIIWGTLGFLVGFASHSDEPAIARIEVASSVQIPAHKRILYRFVAGLLLSYIAGMIVCAIGMGMFFVGQNDLSKTIVRTRFGEEMDLFFIGFCGMVGAEAGAIVGCWLAALLTPGGNALGPIAKPALVSAALGGLSGGWLGALTSLLRFEIPLAETLVIVLAVSAGGIAGIGCAVVMRFRGPCSK